MPALIEARSLRRSFGDLVAVRDVNLRVEAGESYGLLGADGAGKTTTMRLLCAALEADAGQVFLGGFDLGTQTEEARTLIGYLPQRFSLYGDLTVRENLQFFAEVRGLPRRDWAARSEEILAFVGMTEFADRRAEQLSGGMRQKLGLAAALVHRPKILLLDEPTGGVDPVTRQAFWQLLVQLLAQGTAVLISTPYMDEAARCARVGFLHRGSLLIEGSPRQVARRLQGRVISVVGRPRRVLEQVAAQDPEVQSVQLFGDRLHLRVAAGSAEAVMGRLPQAAAAAGGEIGGLSLIEPTLEDAFMDLLEGAGDRG